MCLTVVSPELRRESELKFVSSWLMPDTVLLDWLEELTKFEIYLLKWTAAVEE